MEHSLTTISVKRLADCYLSTGLALRKIYAERSLHRDATTCDGLCRWIMASAPPGSGTKVEDESKGKFCINSAIYNWPRRQIKFVDTVKLEQASSHLWAVTFDRELKIVFSSITDVIIVRPNLHILLHSSCIVLSAILVLVLKL